MVFKTYFDKFCTIIKDSKQNTGLNPISTLVYGRNDVVSRALMHFDHSKVKCLIDDGVMPHMEKMRHILHITNGGSLDLTEPHRCGFSMVTDNYSVRATSFDVIFFLIPKSWDRGKGYSYKKNFFNSGYYSSTQVNNERLLSEDGCNWFQRSNGLPWEGDGTENGVYSNEFLSAEYDKWSCGEDSVVIGRQHFDVGNESIELDITDTFNKFLLGEKDNFGIGMAFSPMLEIKESEYENYVTWYTDKTSNFFEPYVETRYDDFVSDDRSNFVLGKDNKLYLYCTIGEHLENLDKNPTVTIKNGDDEIIMECVESKNFSKGIYYIDLKLSSSDFKADTMLFDTWDDIFYHGEKLNAVELDFVTKPTSNYFNIGNSLNTTNMAFTPSTSGINEKEQIKRGDVRKLVISAKPNYTQNVYQLVDSMDIRLYVKDGMGEIDVISWDKVNKSFSENYYMIDTNILIPQRYYVDIRISYGMNSIIHHDVLSFDIVNDLDNRYA